MIDRKFVTALIQLDSSDNVSKNLPEISNLVKQASKKADLVILPEHSDAVGENEKMFEQPVPGRISDFFSNLAKESGVFIHCGSITETGSEGKPFNTSLVFAPDGTDIAKYSKLHLFDVVLPDGTACRESDSISAGEKIVVADLPFCRLGLSICYDLRFPELYRSMALMGADLMVVSANFTAQTGKFHWKPLLQARAIENGCYVAAVNQCGKKAQFEAWGHSMLIDPWGNIMAELEQKPGIIYGEIDPDLMNATRAKIPSLLNRRSDLY